MHDEQIVQLYAALEEVLEMIIDLEHEDADIEFMRSTVETVVEEVRSLMED